MPHTVAHREQEERANRIAIASLNSFLRGEFGRNSRSRQQAITNAEEALERAGLGEFQRVIQPIFNTISGGIPGSSGVGDVTGTDIDQIIASLEAGNTVLPAVPEITQPDAPFGSIAAAHRVRPETGFRRALGLINAFGARSPIVGTPVGAFREASLPRVQNLFELAGGLARQRGETAPQTLGEFSVGLGTPFAQFNQARQLLGQARGLSSAQLGDVGLGGTALGTERDLLSGRQGALHTALSGTLSPGALNYLLRVLPRFEEEFRLSNPSFNPGVTVEESAAGVPRSFLQAAIDRFNLAGVLGQ